MPFIFITNPQHGDFVAKEDHLYSTLVSDGALEEYDDYIPALSICRETSYREVERFNANYGDSLRAVVYASEPTSQRVRDWCSSDTSIYHHIILNGVVPASFTRAIPDARKVIIYDHFKKQIRNADYPPTELFTDMNTSTSSVSVGWGDFSIVGDNYSESGGPAYAVTVHHVHKSEENDALYINHYISDRQETAADTSGKIMEAVVKLVDDLESLAPNTTDACETYRRMVESGNPHSLGYLKRLAIMHHLEIMLEHD